MMATVCLALLAGLLAVGSLIDIECRRLPNWLTFAVAALFPVFVVVSPTPIDWVSASIVAASVFALGFICFALGLMGGGDVKLFAGLALWAGINHIALFLLVTSLAGGLLSIAMIIQRRWIRSPIGIDLPPLVGVIARRLSEPATPDNPSSSAAVIQDDITDTLPYGVAIAAGGFTVIYALLQL